MFCGRGGYNNHQRFVETQTMFFPIAIELPSHDGEAFGVVVPDLKGCFSAGGTIDEAIANAKEAIDLHLSGLSDDGVEIPVAGSVALHRLNPEFEGWVWAVVEVDITRYLGKAEKINITLPASLIRRIDEYVASHPKQTRSGFLAESALDRLAGRTG